MHNFPRLNLQALGLAALLAPLSGCANLDPIALGQCGNGVIDPGEDCDSFDRLEMTCRPAGGQNACRFDCSDQNRCTAGYACGLDDLCRAPSGRFEYRATLSDPAKFIIAQDFDANGEVDLLAGDDTGTVVSYQAGDFKELDTIDLSIDSATTLINGGQLTEDAMADVTYSDVYLGSLGVSRGTPEPTLAGTVYPTLAIPANHAVVFGLDASPLYAGDEALGVIDVPNVGTLLLEVNVSYGNATPGQMLTAPGMLPSLGEERLSPVRGGHLDPSKPCQQYVLAFQDNAFVGTPCLDDGLWNGAGFDVITGPLGQVPVPPAQIDLAGCQGDLDRAFVLDADDDGDLDVVLTPYGDDSPEGVPLCWLPGPISIPSDGSANLVADPYPLVALATSSSGAVERILDLVDLNGDGVPDLVSSVGIFTSQTEPCAVNLLSHPQADPTIFFCSTASDVLNFSDYAFAAVGDVNRDQNWDVALVGRGDDSVQIQMGHGDGSFAVYNVDAEGTPYHPVFGDFDGDGLDDLMFADKVCPDATRCPQQGDPSDILTVAFGRITGGPEEPRSLGRVPGIEALQTARFQDDSGQGIDATVDLGVLAQDPTDNSFGFAIMSGNTRRELQANFYLTSSESTGLLNPVDLAVGRFVQSNENGAPIPASAAGRAQQDIVVATWDFSGLSFDAVQLWLADVQGEAKLSASRVWPSDPIGGWDQFNPFWLALTAADLDGDTADELVLASGRGLAIGRVVLDGAHPGFAISQLDIELTVRSTRYPFDEAIAIEDAIGSTDSFASPDGGVGVDPIFVGDSGFAGGPPSVEDAGFTEDEILAAVPAPLQLGDVDGDGWRDIVLIGQDGSEAVLMVLWNDGGEFATDRAGRFVIPPEVTAFGLVNLDVDGGLEIIVAAGSVLTVYDGAEQQLADAVLNFGIISEGGDVRVIQSADFDRDGVPDLVFGHEDQMTLYRGFATDQLDE